MFRVKPLLIRGNYLWFHLPSSPGADKQLRTIWLSLGLLQNVYHREILIDQAFSEDKRNDEEPRLNAGANPKLKLVVAQ